MPVMAWADLLAKMTEIAFEAAAIILDISPADLAPENKSDGSPVTLADRQAGEHITAQLQKKFPYPIVSEEDPEHHPPYPPAAGFFWLVDPLDGTKEFIAGRREFTVNIALIYNRTPVAGVIVAPALNEAFRASPAAGEAERLDTDRIWRPISARTAPAEKATLIASRSHRDATTTAFIAATCPNHEILSVGSSLKFCRLAEGGADIYPRFGPTMEWDTAAGQAILTAAGGSVHDLDDNTLLYGKPDYRNGAFVARGKISNS